MGLDVKSWFNPKMERVQVQGEMLRWARARAGLSSHILETKFPRLEQWEKGESHPTLKQLEAFAKVTHAPVGYLFLDEPPDEPLPIPDFRTISGTGVRRPSPDLLEMIYACQHRQDWFREYAAQVGDGILPFVGSVTTRSSVVETAEAIRKQIGFNMDARARCGTWADALRLLTAQIDGTGVLVMSSGIVMNNTHRKLNPKEFRGFALADNLAPLIFVNGADSKSAQMFTLAHELAHLWLGKTGLSDSTVASQNQNAIETWCNRVAAEILAPIQRVRESLLPNEELTLTVARLAREFKVSTLVILQRLRDVGTLTWTDFNRAYEQELDKIGKVVKPSAGGDFYMTTAVRYSRRFARALIGSTLEGRTLYRDAFRLLGISKPETFHELGRTLHFSAQ